jgi:hypothetical protein
VGDLAQQLVDGSAEVVVEAALVRSVELGRHRSTALSPRPQETTLNPLRAALAAMRSMISSSAVLAGIQSIRY